jgi:hypothetical protein
MDKLAMKLACMQVTVLTSVGVFKGSIEAIQDNQLDFLKARLPNARKLNCDYFLAIFSVISKAEKEQHPTNRNSLRFFQLLSLVQCFEP